jgi:hypothetical protein
MSSKREALGILAVFHCRLYLVARLLIRGTLKDMLFGDLENVHDKLDSFRDFVKSLWKVLTIFNVGVNFRSCFC